MAPLREAAQRRSELSQQQLLVKYLLDVLSARDVEAAVRHHHVQPRPRRLPADERLECAQVATLVEISVVLRPIVGVEELGQGLVVEAL